MKLLDFSKHTITVKFERDELDVIFSVLNGVGVEFERLDKEILDVDFPTLVRLTDALSNVISATTKNP